MELEDTVFDDSNVPSTPGVYAIMYAARLQGVQDYWGDYDVDVDVEWTKIVKLSEEESQAVLDGLKLSYYQ